MVQNEILFKDMSYLEFWRPPCLVEQNRLCNFGRRHHEEHFCEMILNLEHWFRRRCRLKIILIWSSDGHFVQLSGTIGAMFVNGHNEKQFFARILNFDQWFRRRCRLNVFLIWSSGSPFVQRSKTVSAILVEACMRNNSAQLF